MKLRELITALSVLPADTFVALGVHQSGGVAPILCDIELMYYRRDDGHCICERVEPEIDVSLTHGELMCAADIWLRAETERRTPDEPTLEKDR